MHEQYKPWPTLTTDHISLQNPLFVWTSRRYPTQEATICKPMKGTIESTLRNEIKTQSHTHVRVSGSGIHRIPARAGDINTHHQQEGIDHRRVRVPPRKEGREGGAGDGFPSKTQNKIHCDQTPHQSLILRDHVLSPGNCV